MITVILILLCMLMAIGGAVIVDLIEDGEVNVFGLLGTDNADDDTNKNDKSTNPSQVINDSEDDTEPKPTDDVENDGSIGSSEASKDLAAVKHYLFSMYKDVDTVTKVSFSRVGVVTINGVSYEVTWTSNNDAVTITPNGNMVEFTVPECPEEEIKYTVTATIKDADGNTETLVYEYTVPAAVGDPSQFADGTYVIVVGNLTMSSLAEDKNYGYPHANEVSISNGVVTGYTSDDILTIKSVAGGYTIQDAYGRYFYLRGAYNSLDVSAEIPAEGGHIFNILKNGDTYLILNAMNKKILAYSTNYSSWGCYSELDDDRNSALMLYAVVTPR